MTNSISTFFTPAQEPIMANARTIIAVINGNTAQLVLPNTWVKDTIAKLGASADAPDFADKLAFSLAIAELFFQRQKDSLFEVAYTHRDKVDPESVDAMYMQYEGMLFENNESMLANHTSKTARKWEHLWTDLFYLD
jgi:hypothetical protein